ncbi:MAG: GAF domain-containing protein [Planctomycetes bacterium]|nr:GAF domain-containing protein [Planctomycetota bacterium]
MLEAQIHPDDHLRVAALQAYGVLDTPPEPAFDDIVQLASQICSTPVALVSLVDGHRQWFKAKVGLDATETPRSVSFCGHAIHDPDNVFVIPDASLDERFADNPLVTGPPSVQFYAGAPLVDPGGAVLGTLCVIDHQPRLLGDPSRTALEVLARRVVSELRLRQYCARLEAQKVALERANRDLEEFAGIAAHDLQAPSRRVAMLVQLVRDDLGDGVPAEVGQQLDLIERTAKGGVRLVQGLLGLCEVRGAVMKPERVPLDECVDAALLALGESRTDVGGRVSVSELPEVDVDRQLVTQLLQNLMANSLKFVGEAPPEIEISSTRVGDDWVVSVADNGIGIAAEDRQRVFKPFQRLHPASRFPGSGIGLPFCRRVVEKHGGRIWADDNPDGGAVFRFTLPATGAPAPTLATSAS